ncbi:cupin domain-containing protein [bacterium 1xD42-87]|nr:cupin domain-containing protein [bacterium 1xD42-87]
MSTLREPGFFPFYPLHWHEEMEIIYICSGQGVITIQSYPYIVKTDDIVIIKFIAGDNSIRTARFFLR